MGLFLDYDNTDLWARMLTDFTLYLQCENQIVLKGTFDLSIKTEVVCSFVVLRRPTSPPDKPRISPGLEPIIRDGSGGFYN